MFMLSEQNTVFITEKNDLKLILLLFMPVMGNVHL